MFVVINNCWNRWKRPVMICEVGMNWQKADAEAHPDK